MMATPTRHTEVMKLIVKAPNQLIEDQNVDCDLTWTVLNLKEHLSHVYPSKPAVAEQKLIYSGQLLTDDIVLKDVLRKYEGQNTHSMHLVCAPPRGTPDSWKRSTTNVSQIPQQSQSVPSAVTSSQSQVSAPATRTTVTATSSTATPPVTESTASNTPITTAVSSSSQGQEGWNWLHATQQQFLAASAQYPTMAVYPQAAMAQMYDPVSLAQMQQIYSQYMAQYLCHLQQAGVSAEVLGTMHAQAQQNWGMHQNQAQMPRVAPAVNPAIPAMVNQQNIAAAPQMLGADDEEMRLGRQRDWLDWFYVLSRLIVLFSIVYFYSSLKRFILVSTLGLVLYLYHLGYFRLQQPVGVGGAAEAENNNQPAGEREPNVAEAAQNPEVEREAVENAEQPQVNPEEADGVRQRRQDNPGDAPANLPPPLPVEAPSVFMLTWTFVSSFFASLIPDRPNVV